MAHLTTELDEMRTSHLAQAEGRLRASLMKLLTSLEPHATAPVGAHTLQFVCVCVCV